MHNVRPERFDEALYSRGGFRGEDRAHRSPCNAQSCDLRVADSVFGHFVAVSLQQLRLSVCNDILPSALQVRVVKHEDAHRRTASPRSGVLANWYLPRDLEPHRRRIWNRQSLSQTSEIAE